MTVWTAWDNRHLWPQNDPDGYVFLGYAFDAAGEAIFPNWTGHEVEDAAKKRPERLPTVEQAFIDGKPHYGFHKRYGPEIRALCGLFEGEDIPQAAWRTVAEDRLREWHKVVDAEWRRDEVIWRLSELARTGELAFASRRKGGGQKPTPIASEAWELDFPWVPFATLGCDERLGLASPSPTSWLFVDAASFGRCLGAGSPSPSSSAASYLIEAAAEADEQSKSPAPSGLDLQELDKHHKQVMASAKAVSEVREWLTKDWEDSDSISVTKAKAWEIARTRWGDRISLRAFTAEWQKLRA